MEQVDAGFNLVWATKVGGHRDEERVLAHTRAVLLRWSIQRDRLIIPIQDERGRCTCPEHPG